MFLNKESSSYLLKLFVIFSCFILEITLACTPTYNTNLTIDNACTTGYYLLKSDNTVIDTSNIADCATGTCKLYECSAADGSTACITSSITGYAVFALGGSRLSCTNGTCVPYTITSSCNSVGVLFNTSAPKLCNVSGGSGVALSAATATYYYLEIPSTSATGVPFTANSKILVKVENNSVSIVDDKTYYINGSNYLATEAEYQKSVDGTIKKYVVTSKVVSGTVEISCKVAFASGTVTISGSCGDGNYLIKGSSPVSLTTLASCTGTACKLYSCPSIEDGQTTATCSTSTITGYTIFVLDSSWLSCKSGACVAYSVGTSCDANSVGAIVDSSAPKFCNESSGSGVLLSGVSGEEYHYLEVPGTAATGIPFTANTKVLVKVESDLVSIVGTDTYVKNSDNTESSSDDYENDITGAITKYSIANGVATPEPSCAVAYTSETLTITSTCNIGYYLVSSASAIIDKSTIASASGCTLWKCPEVAANAETATCVKANTITGYVPFALNDSMLTCTAGSCSPATVGTGNCGSRSLGKLVDSTAPKFCIGTTEESALDITSKDLTYHYLEIPSDATGIPLTASKNYLIEVGGGAAIVVDDGEKYIKKESKEATDSDTFMDCASHNSITRYTIASGEVTATKDCVQVCTLLETGAKGCVAEGYYIANAQKVYTEADDTEGTLYYCSTATSCKSVTTSDLPIGYLLNSGNRGYTDETDVPYIKCELDQGSVKCKAMAVTGTACTASTVEVINDSGIYKLCLGTTTITDTVELSTSTTNKYLVSMAGNNVYGAQKESHFVIVNLSKGNALLNNDNLDRYQITLTSTDYKIQEKTVENCSSILCPSNTLVTTLQEYSLNKEEGDTLNYYKQV